MRSLLGFHEIDSFLYLSLFVVDTSDTLEREGMWVGQGMGSLYLTLCTGTRCCRASPARIGDIKGCLMTDQIPVDLRVKCCREVQLYPCVMAVDRSSAHSSIYCVRMRWVTQGFELTLYGNILWGFGNSQDLAWSWQESWNTLFCFQF